MTDLITKIEAYPFECEGGNLVNCSDWHNLKGEIARLTAALQTATEALDRVANAVWWMQQDQLTKTGSINGLDGAMCVTLANDPSYLRKVAREALSKLAAIRGDKP